MSFLRRKQYINKAVLGYFSTQKIENLIILCLNSQIFKYSQAMILRHYCLFEVCQSCMSQMQKSFESALSRNSLVDYERSITQDILHLLVIWYPVF